MPYELLAEIITFQISQQMLLIKNSAVNHVAYSSYTLGILGTVSTVNYIDIQQIVYSVLALTFCNLLLNAEFA